MKTSFTFLITTSFIMLLMACNKIDGTAPATIAGTWNLVSDSTHAGVGIFNHPVNYIGQPGDYFNFTTNGFLYTKEGAVLDTLTYKVVAANKLVIERFSILANGVPDTCTVTNLTAHTATIAIKNVFTPAGAFGRSVNLSR